jgi:hypothetical protein
VRKALSGGQGACDSALAPRLAVAPLDEASRPQVRLEGEGLDCGKTYELVITRPDGTRHSETLTADEKGKVQGNASPGGPAGNTQATLHDSSGAEVARTLYFVPVFRYGHLTWRQVGPRTAEFSVINVFSRVYPGSGPDGLAVTGDTFQEYAGSTNLCFGDGTCDWVLTYEVTGYDAEAGWVLARAINPGEPQTQPGSGVLVTESEPNNGIYTQDSLQLGDDYASDISVPLDLDYARFTLTRTTHVEVRTVPQGLWDPYLYLFDAQGTVIASDDDSGEGLASLITITLDAGTYYLGAAAFSGLTGTQRVQLRERVISPPGPITHVYEWDGPFTASISGCCRIEGLSNLANAWSWVYQVETGVDFTRDNSSPVSTLPPVVEAPANTPDFSFQIPATDPDGDELTFRLATGMESYIAQPPPGLTVSSTGLVSWSTVGTVRGQRWVVQVIIEERRDGQLLGWSAVDFLLKTTGDTGTAPSCVPPPQGDYTAMPGELVSFTIGTQDAEAWDLLTLTADGLPWGAWLEPGLPQQGFSGIGTTFTWLTSEWDVGATYPLRFTVTDSTGQQGECLINITVQNPSNWPPVVYLNPYQGGYEGETITLSGGAYDPDGDALTYLWTLEGGTGPAVTLSSPTSPTTTFRALDDGHYTFRLTATDSEGASGSATVVVQVFNQEPVVHATGGWVDEGQVFTSSGYFTDPGADSWTATVDYDDGEGPQPLALNNRTFTLSHRYRDNSPWGSYWVRIFVRDDDLGLGWEYVYVVVNNVAPRITQYPSRITTGQGQPIVVPIAFTDPGADSWSGFVDYGDGPTDFMWLASRELTLQHTWYLPGTYSLWLRVQDDDTGWHEVTIPVEVRNLPPVISLEGGTLDEGSVFTSVGSFSDPESWQGGYSITVDYGDGTGVEPLYSSGYDNRFQPMHAYVDNGTYLMTVTVTDALGAVGRATATVVVNNVAPRVTVSNDSPAYWGLPINLVGRVRDPGPADTQAGFTALWTLGDGTTAPGLTTAHVYAAPGTYQASLRVTDKDGASNTDPGLTSVTVQQRPGAVACADTTAVFGFLEALDARFVDGLAGALPGGRSVSFRLGASTDLGTVTTDAAGLARLRLPGGLMPGSHPLTVTFAGDSHYTAAQARCTLTVIQSNGRFTGGGLLSANQGHGGFNVTREEGGPVRGELQFRSGGTVFHAHQLTALGLSTDQRRAWFAGVGQDGRAFTAYVEDNGEPGTSDVFRLWIDGVPQTGEGTLLAGNIQAH